jgi:hypothetical protein
MYEVADSICANFAAGRTDSQALVVKMISIENALGNAVLKEGIKS